MVFNYIILANFNKTDSVHVFLIDLLSFDQNLSLRFLIDSFLLLKKTCNIINLLSFDQNLSLRFLIDSFLL